MAKLKSFDERRIEACQQLHTYIGNLEKRFKIIITRDNPSQGKQYAIQKVLELVDVKELVELLEKKAGKRWGKHLIEAVVEDMKASFNPSTKDENKLVLEFKPLQADLEAEEAGRYR